jgi:hypothetical protein
MSGAMVSMDFGQLEDLLRQAIGQQLQVNGRQCSFVI